MIVHNFDLMRTIAVPSKTNPPLALDLDTVCPALLAYNFPTIRGTRRYVAEIHGGVQHHQLALGRPLEA